MYICVYQKQTNFGEMHYGVSRKKNFEKKPLPIFARVQYLKNACEAYCHLAVIVTASKPVLVGQ